MEDEPGLGGAYLGIDYWWTIVDEMDEMDMMDRMDSWI